MDLEQLRCFISVADNHSFTLAAKQLFSSQPVISRQIASLENEMGGQLFIRSKRSVTLTPEGKKLLENAREIVHKSYELLNYGHELLSVGAGSFCLGYPGYGEFNFISDVITRFAHDGMHVNLTFIREHHGMLCQKLRAGECDAAIALLPSSSLETSFPYLDWKVIDWSPLYAAVPLYHPLAGRKEISLAQLADEQIVCIHRSEDPVFNDLIIKSCNRFNFSPKYFPSQPMNVQDMILLVCAGKGVAICAHWLKMYENKNLDFLQLRDVDETIELCCIYRKNDQSPFLSAFLRALDETPTDCFRNYDE